VRSAPDSRAPRRRGRSVAPNAAGWHAVAEAEHDRARGVARPDRWAGAADTWERLDRPPLAAYCRWREAEALVAAGAPRATRRGPSARRTRRRPVSTRNRCCASSSCSPSGRGSILAPDEPQPAASRPGGRARADAARGEVLALVARGLTNREIADAS
jgi:hypothetical protein